MRKVFLATLVLAGVLSTPTIASAVAYGDRGDGGYDPPPGDTEMHVYVREGCPHCADFKAMMEKWGEDGPDVTYYEVTKKETRALFKEVEDRLPGLQQGVPTIILDGKVVQGYETDLTTGQIIKGIYDECKDREGGCITYQEFLDGAGAKDIASLTDTCSGDPEDPCESNVDDSKFIFDLWFVGETDLRDLSLPALSLLLGGLDGFNPCAMWVLISLLTLLINTRSWKKIIVIGSTFLLVSGVMYYFFIAAWLNVFLLIGYVRAVQVAIGVVAIGGGSFYLYEAFGKDPNQCKVTDYKQRNKTIERMKKVVSASSWPAMIGGVSILAISVNMVELVCTAGLPAIFTQILAFNGVTAMEGYWYLLLYILAYMFDDMIIYIIAITTLHATGLTTKYRRFTLIFGGVMMGTLGILMIFWPEALTFH